LQLSNTNKIALKNLVNKPHTPIRYILRPILTWRIDGVTQIIVGRESLKESLFSLVSNAIPWGIAPKEWMQRSEFKNYVRLCEDNHDKILDDKVESILKPLGLEYYRGVKKLKILGVSKNLERGNDNIGEIDFVVFDTAKKIIYIVENKYLRSKHDSITWSSDYTNFREKYEGQLRRKVDWVNSRLDSLTEWHNYGIDSSFSVIGLFVINTPTLYMFTECPYEVVMISKLEERLKNGTEQFTAFVEMEDGIAIIEKLTLKEPDYILNLDEEE
jgi:hypothetical protein